MSTYTSKNKISESKNELVNESSKQKKQTLLTIILIFFLILLLLFSVLVSNKFTITSIDIKDSNKQLDLSYHDLNGKTATAPSEVPIKTEEKPVEITKPIETTKPAETPAPVKQEEKATQKATTEKTQTTQKQAITPSEAKVGVDGKIITAYNIQKYHDILLKEFANKEILNYQIVWGDTLWKIAMKFNTSAHTLYVLNALSNPDLIIAGKNLKVVKNFILQKERTEFLLNQAIKNKTSLNYGFERISQFTIQNSHYHLLYKEEYLTTLI
ncbi:MAG: LysM peptidoglycan-binding domain-containing protein [Spirochaetes bacterium]|nr:LysM peptidoglycan-binding domain-containing protein [Spirochaetota bacterium]NLJ04338.1 LysM peptidoglycan-binding domain-containing protein [Exilispira sp.]MBP8991386.1 LysM peptidoglycan-binding domain-containing protein [Spirochaetota bacterium]HNV43506.1 LysM domain-containing protein [Exilispira sp.]HOV46273.1 LysM domain-containing protein [Exilispira sp.]